MEKNIHIYIRIHLFTKACRNGTLVEWWSVGMAQPSCGSVVVDEACV